MLLCIAAAFLVYAAATNPVTAPKRPSTASPVQVGGQTPGATAQFSAPPLSTLTESVERPLFSAGRRPFSPEQPVVATASPIQKGEFALVGVSIRSDRRDALFRRNSTGALSWVGEGDKLEGWVVKTVQADRVILEQGGERDEIELWSAENKPPVAPPARTNVPRPGSPPPNAMPRVPAPGTQQGAPPARQARPAPRTGDR
jgi:hypothetical protein